MTFTIRFQDLTIGCMFKGSKNDPSKDYLYARNLRGARAFLKKTKLDQYYKATEKTQDNRWYHRPMTQAAFVEIKEPHIGMSSMQLIIEMSSKYYDGIHIDGNDITIINDGIVI